MNFSQAAEDYRRIEKALHFLETHFHRQPELAEVAAAANLSEYHFQRLFSRWVGISPKRFLQYLTKEYAKER
ncbi:MAG: helix-turn-helix transcriptional regulator, partial [Calditrichaeota bacterium]|nr:helix-turn-helix transcriptional regulator [Calditrichota bacterium]